MEEEPMEEEPQEEPQEEEPQEEPQEQEYIPSASPRTPEEGGGPWRRMCRKFHTNGELGGQATEDLKAMMDKIGLQTVLSFTHQVIPMPNWDEWMVELKIYDGNHEFSSHVSPVPRVSEQEAVADAIWAATTSMAHRYRHKLHHSRFRHYPCRMPGSRKILGFVKEDPNAGPAQRKRDEAMLRVYRQYRAALDEIDYLRAELEEALGVSDEHWTNSSPPPSPSQPVTTTRFQPSAVPPPQRFIQD